jgi:preprotein translocase subunit Sss1
VKTHPRGSNESPMSLYDAACAVAGSLFVGLTGYITIAALIWSLSVMLSIPMAVIAGLLVIGLLGFIGLTIRLTAHALWLQLERDRGNPLA